MKIEDFLTYIPEGFIYSYDDLSNLVLKYQERINKAIAYIEAGKTFANEETAKLVEHIQNDLLDILKGSDNNDM